VELGNGKEIKKPPIQHIYKVIYILIATKYIYYYLTVWDVLELRFISKSEFTSHLCVNRGTRV